MNETKKSLVIKAIAQGKKKKKRACVELNDERQINRLLLAINRKEKKPSDTETEIENQNMQTLMKSKNVS